MRHRRSVLKVLLITIGFGLVATGFAGLAAPTVSGQWTNAGVMGEGRSGAAAVLLDDGRVMVIGGSGATGPTGVADTSSADGLFATTASMITARTHHTAVRLLDGRVLVAGGTTAAGAADGTGATANAATNTAEIYDPALDTWAPAGEMTEPRARHTASLLADGRVLIAGGEHAGAASGTLEIFDPATSAFTPVAAGITPRTWHAAATLADGRVVLAGGVAGANALASIDIFNPADGTVVQAALMSPRAAASATTLLNGSVLIAGGYDGEHDLASAEVFDPGTNVSTASATMVSPRSGHQAFLLPHNNSVLIVGGTAAGNPLAAAELFAPWAGEFRSTGALHEARAAAAGTPLAQEGQLMIVGGTDGSAALSSAEGYRFATVKTDLDDYAPGQTVTITGQGWEPGETVTLLLHEAPHPLWHDDRTLTAVADSSGRIVSAEFAPEAHHVGVRFYLTATGTASQAQVTFTDGELLTAELVGTANDVTVTQGTTANFTILVSSAGQPLKCSATILNPATATVRTVYTLSAAGVLSSSTPSTPLAFFAGTPISGPNCQTTWNFAPTPYSVAATINAAATTPVGDYSIILSASAGTTTATTPGGMGSSLADATPTTIVVHVVAPADSTPPVITPTVTGTAGSNGWYVSDVTVSWAVSDAESSVSSTTGCDTTTVTTDTAGTVITCSATSAGGTATQSVTIKRDTSPPTAALSVSAGTAGTNGWYTSDVTVQTSGTDTISGPVTCTGDQQQTTETAETAFNGSCTNDAGLTGNAAPLTVKVDKTGPSAALSVTAGTAGANGWYTSDVTVHASGTDTISSPVTCTDDQQQATETAGTAFNASCTNDAGLTTDASALTIKLDKTGPTAVSSSVTSGTPGANGWYTSNVTVHTTGTEDISGPADCSADHVLTTETAGQNVAASCTNQAGLTTDAAPLTIKLDKTAPTGVSSSVTLGTPGANGWYTSDVTVHTTGTEDVSGPADCSADQVLTTETAGQNVAGSCTNKAGLTTNAAPLPIKLDKTGPSAALSVTAGTAGANGWYTSNVTVHASGTDTISSPVTCTGDQQQTTETAGTAFNGSCTNDAGLTTNASALTIKLDKTAPTGIALSVTAGTAGLNGWYISDVTVSTTGTDSISTPVVCTAPQHQTSDTTGTAFNGSCTNNAGLVTQGAALTVKVDETAPVITLVTPADGGSYLLNASVDAQYSCQDATSGPATCAGPVASGADLATGAVGPHTFSVTATDNAGNTATRANTYHVTFSTAACLGDAGHSVLQPINVDGTSVFKQKSTVPVKFRVCDANGNSIGLNVVAGFSLVSMTAGTTTTAVNEPVDSTTPNDTFRWDPSAQQWIFNSNTKSLSANRTYGFAITLTDSTVIQYQFGLR
jgi:hypothetical protein